MLSLFEVPHGVLNKIEYYRSKIFDKMTNIKKEISFVKWDILCQPKEHGGPRA